MRFFFLKSRQMGLTTSLDGAMILARSDQQLAEYPGCREGRMYCLDQTCVCDERKPCERFVLARAERIRKRLKGLD